MGSRNLLDASGYGQQLICELTVTRIFACHLDRSVSFKGDVTSRLLTSIAPVTRIDVTRNSSRRTILIRCIRGREWQ